MLCAILAAAALAASAAPPPPAVPEMALDDTALASARGGESPDVTTVSSQTLSGVSGGNTVNATNVATGGVTIGSGAFSGFNGLGNFVVNTGNNNVVQGALSVSISMPTIR